MASKGECKSTRGVKRKRLGDQGTSSETQACSPGEGDVGDVSTSRATVWQKWSVDDVGEELKNNGFGDDVVEKFKAQKTDGSVLDKITVGYLRDQFEIKDFGTQQKIMAFLKQKGCFASDMSGTDYKVFNDAVHGHMEFHPLCVAVIDTQQFQRLRYIKQLGGCYFVFPGAAHNRFEHSLGVCHLAGQLVRDIQRRQPELHITDKDVLCVQIAGLCRDLGHGPFSDVFCKFVNDVRSDLKGLWEPQQTSLKMFKHMVQENNLEEMFKKYELTDKDIVFIEEQIRGLEVSSKLGDWKSEGRTQEKAFLYEIVANRRNGIDVETWDSLQRDCLHLGMNSSFDHKRFIHFARVLSVKDQMQICVRDKEALNMYELFHTRFALHRRAYKHKVTHIVEILLCQVLKLADECLQIPGETDKTYKISQCIDHGEAYTNLTDHVFHQILLSDSKDPNMLKAKHLLKKIHRRKLYKCLAETVPISLEKTAPKDEKTVTEDILQAAKEDRQKLRLDDRVLIKVVTLDFGKEDKNPVDEICFYSKGDKNHAKPVMASEVSLLINQSQFKEQIVRLYMVPSDQPDEDTVKADVMSRLLSSFRVWCKSHKLNPPKSFVDV